MSQRVRFDRFELDLASGELRAGTESVRLEPQPARVLAHLIAHRGQVVSRQDLQRAVWPAETFVDFDRGLNYCIAEIRKALGDSAASPRMLETLPRRGYRFLATVERLADDASEQPRLGASWHRWALAALCCVLLVGLGVAAFRAHQVPPPTVAVALFDDETPAADAALFAQRLTDAVVEGLAREPERWGVIGNAALLRTTRALRDPALLGPELGADFAVLGQVQEVDGRRNVLVHLIRVADLKHVWAERFVLGAEAEAAVQARLQAAVRAALLERGLAQ
jgi:DNA-binding winged helix-turn-helix (wHTH) protein/TolB-like protein